MFLLEHSSIICTEEFKYSTFFQPGIFSPVMLCRVGQYYLFMAAAAAMLARTARKNFLAAPNLQLGIFAPSFRLPSLRPSISPSSLLRTSFSSLFQHIVCITFTFSPPQSISSLACSAVDYKVGAVCNHCKCKICKLTHLAPEFQTLRNGKMEM